MRLSVVLAACAGAGLSACTGGGPGDNCPEEPLLLELGTGATVDWQPLADGDAADVVFGPQGGFHVDAAGRVGPINQLTQLSGTLTIPQAQSEVATGLSSTALADYDNDTCEGVFFGFQVIFTIPTREQICMANGRDAELSVTVEDVDQTVSITESRRVRLRLDPADCQR